MYLYKNEKISNEKQKISSNIWSWYIGHDDLLNIISLPYNSSEIFVKLIITSINLGKNVLYITEEDERNIAIVECLKKYSNFRDYVYFRKKVDIHKKKLVIVNYENVKKINSKFDLVIYDDINSLPICTKTEICELIKQLREVCGKAIGYSLERCFEDYEEICLPIDNYKYPMIEPRLVTTKIDIEKDIPYLVYEYLNWAMKLNKKVIIYLPNEEKAEKVYGYMSSSYMNLCKNIILIKNGDSYSKKLNKFLLIEGGIAITDEIKDNAINIKNTVILVFFADNIKFDLKKLVNFCGRVEKGDINRRGEVVFLAYSDSENMEKARDLTRWFNKEAWELGLLNI